MNVYEWAKPRRRKHNWGRRIVIDTPDRLKELVMLMQLSFPSNMRVSLYEGGTSKSHLPVRQLASLPQPVEPLPFQPNAGSSDTVRPPEPFLAEVRAKLIVNERLGWMLSIYFCIGELLTAHELVTKVQDAFRILQSWSDAHTLDESTWAELPCASPHIQ